MENIFETLANITKPIQSGAIVKIIDNNCVNSNHHARWISSDEEPCECIVGCKIEVSVEQNGHKPYTYVVTQKELNQLEKL